MMKRREFSRKAGRGILLALLGAAGIKLGLTRRLTDTDYSCIQSDKYRGICSRCRIARKCRLPQAQSYRREHG